VSAADGIVGAAVTRCPYCRSSNVSVSAKQTASTYRRCDACGELWHPDRIKPSAGLSNDRLDWTTLRR
jgi:hypothetical protein